MSPEQQHITFEDNPEPVKGNLREKTAQWIERNPDIFAIFEREALALAAQHRRFGAKQLAEKVRWQYSYQYQGEQFKLCNSFISYIARELVARHPELAQLMKFRRCKDEILPHTPRMYA